MPRKLSERRRAFLLSKQAAVGRKDLIPVLLRARERVTARIEHAIKDKRYATVKRIRNGLERDLAKEYRKLHGDLDGWTSKGIRRNSKEWHRIAKNDLLMDDGDRAAISWTKFSGAHLQDYIERINPFNEERLAATGFNPQVSKMLRQDVEALRRATVEVFAETMAAGSTPVERYNLLRSRVESYADDPKSWQFISKPYKTKTGKLVATKWKPGNYFSMLNRTVSANAARDSYHDTLADEGRDTVKLIGGLSDNSHEACIEGLGKIYSLTGQTKGLPLLSEYEEAGGFHPNCVHFTVYVSPETESGQDAIAEGKESPPDFTPITDKQEKNASKKEGVSKAEKVPAPSVPDNVRIAGPAEAARSDEIAAGIKGELSTIEKSYDDSLARLRADLKAETEKDFKKSLRSDIKRLEKQRDRDPDISRLRSRLHAQERNRDLLNYPPTQSDVDAVLKGLAEARDIGVAPEQKILITGNRPTADIADPYKKLLEGSHAYADETGRVIRIIPENIRRDLDELPRVGLGDFAKHASQYYDDQFTGTIVHEVGHFKSPVASTVMERATEKHAKIRAGINAGNRAGAKSLMDDVSEYALWNEREHAAETYAIFKHPQFSSFPEKTRNAVLEIWGGTT